MKVTIPELSLIVLIGPSGAGKSTFAARHFAATEVLSSDACRALVADDENDQSATEDAFQVLHYIAARRLARGRLAVVDATNVHAEARKPLVKLAREHHVIPVAIVFDVPERLCHHRNRDRPNRTFGRHVVRQQRQQLRRSFRNLKREGFRHLYVFKSPDEIDAAVVERQPLWNNLKHEHGPFDVIGDVHGCREELVELLEQLGYAPDDQGAWTHAEGRKAVFLGDLVDRGPGIVEVLRIVMRMVSRGSALCVPGNHDIKLMRKLKGRNVQVTHGLADSLEQISTESEEFRSEVADWIDRLVSHYVLDDGKLVVAHAGMKEEMQGRGSGKVRDFALYGETTGESDEFGLPIRYDWAAEYRGQARVVYGHTPVPEPEWINRTINIDTGCVFGGSLTALKYPELELLSVPANRTYAEPIRPIAPEVTGAGLTGQQIRDDLLDIEDVSGKRLITTRLRRTVTVREENGIAALEVLSRFAANPKWVIYLPPTMSPTETSRAGGLLEHPAEAFAHYRHQGVPRVVVQEKHMGSRAVLVVCRDESVARRRFGVLDEGAGICYTRTGRRFFDDANLEQEFMVLVREALTASDFWEKLNTDWVCLDAELMPWSAKARELIRSQYAAVGAAAAAALPEVTNLLNGADGKGGDLAPLLERFAERERSAGQFREAYRRYCWNVGSVGDLKLAPFHVLATEGAVHVDKDHGWHMTQIADLCRAADGLLMATDHRVVDLSDADSEAGAVRWWETLTERGEEGAVVKPLSFVARGRKGLLQPAVKVRGREYLRIIYGPEYTMPENLERLRTRRLGHKRSLALREFALGIEGLERFVRGEPLRRVHECVFGVLALESEPVDPRL